MSKDIMVDLETLDTAPTAVVLSIGACRVDWDNECITDEFYRVISVESCAEAGLTTSSDTKSWWDRQSPEARKVFTDPNVPLQQALIEFAAYLEPFDRKKVRIWGNGSDFDNVILSNAYQTLNFETPWRFYNNRCFRTVNKTFGPFQYAMDTESHRGGVYHNALDDAIYQAKRLLKLKPWMDHVWRPVSGGI